MSPGRRPAASRAALLALLALAAAAAGACGEVRLSDTEQRPHWRRPGPAVIEPLPRFRVPDDGFHDNLAAPPLRRQAGAIA